MSTVSSEEAKVRPEERLSPSLNITGPPIFTSSFRYSTLPFTFKCAPLYRTLFLRLFILPFFLLPNTRRRG